jgi:multidrug efflux pump
MSTTIDTAAPKTDRWYLATAPMVRALIHLCVPVAAGEAVGSVYNVVNAGFIGTQHDDTLFAAITFGTPLFALVLAVGGVFGIGGAALMGRLLGESENDPSKAALMKHVSAFAFWGAVIAGAVLAILGLVFLHPLVLALGANAAAVPATSAYVSVMMAFIPVTGAAFALEQIVRSQGAAKQAMIGVILSTIGNLVFDVLFILVLHWGVAGAALSVGLANLVSIAWYASWIARKSEHVSILPKYFTLSPAVVKPVLSIGVTMLLESGFILITTLLLNHLAVAYGDGPLAAMGVAVRIAQVPEFLLMGLTSGVLPLLAYTFGRGDGSRLGSAFRTTAGAIAVVSVVFGVLVFVFRDQVIGLFLSNPSLLPTAIIILLAQLVSMVLNAYTGLFTSLFQAVGKATPAIVMSFAKPISFVPIVILANIWFGLPGIIWALTISEGIVFLVALVMWLRARGSIAAGLAEGSPERAEELLAEA